LTRRPSRLSTASNTNPPSSTDTSSPRTEPRTGTTASNYTVLHTLGTHTPVPSLQVVAPLDAPPAAAALERPQAGSVQSATSLSVVVERGTGAAANPQGQEPASWSSRALVPLIGRLSAARASARAARSEPHAIVFIGHCKWGRGQLQNEIARGSWSLCEATSGDVLEAGDASWQRLQESGRLQEDGDRADDDDDENDTDDAGDADDSDGDEDGEGGEAGAIAPADQGADQGPRGAPLQADQ